MKGTCIKQAKLTKVVDGDTVKVLMDAGEESLRLVCLDTEESHRGGYKPVTNAGKAASKWAKEFFGADDKGLPADDVFVDVEFDTSDPVAVCMKKHRGNYGRLICYVYKDDRNYNFDAVREGWSPYFVKYGRSRLYHEDLMKAEAQAQAQGIGVWDPDINAGGNSRDYGELLPWWHLRAGVVEDYRRFGVQAGALSIRLDYDEIVEAANAKSPLTVLCDLQGGIHKWAGDGALIYAGSIAQKLNLWIPERGSATAQETLRLIETRYAGHGLGYVYVSGEATMYPDENGVPEIILQDMSQLSDFPPGRGTHG